MLCHPTGDVTPEDPGALCFPNGLTRPLRAPYSQRIVRMPGRRVLRCDHIHFLRVIPTEGSRWLGDQLHVTERLHDLDAAPVACDITVSMRKFPTMRHRSWKLFESIRWQERLLRGGSMYDFAHPPGS